MGKWELGEAMEGGQAWGNQAGDGSIFNFPISERAIKLCFPASLRHRTSQVFAITGLPA
jgi:hypothetical protein